ncbi:aromatic ring-hydroxylating dioxygenase subunit alpha [Novosphingobium resinovorum]|uniref:aromatic ring-hydroxylating oxygenase subunit alpha n=1 Tax=Novosphingobium resinovorum TaxID=158500 RepID=UPI002ED30DC1|nr:aromatic ring-hydroxylating dioxygenase subunit alpha [Novosphingobium resinovorum]
MNFQSTPRYSHETGFVRYPDAAPGDPGAKAPFIDHGGSVLSAERYYSGEEAEREWEHMWTRTWQFAGLTHDLAEVGDYFMIDIGRESVIVVRDGPGDEGVNAYFNVCPHRGNRIVSQRFGSLGEKGCFECDFHGWKFDRTGKNVEIKDEMLFRPETIAHRPGLKRMRCGVWNTLVFISMADEGISLRDHLNVMIEHMEVFPLDKFRVIGDFETTWDANWKTALDAFIEFYHADEVHPEVIPFSATHETQYDLYDHGLSRMIVPYGFVSGRHEDQDTVNPFLQMYVQFFGGNPDDYTDIKGYEYWKALADTKRKWAARHGYTDFFDQLDDRRVTDDWNYFVFPNITINYFAEALLIQIFRPHPTDPEKSFYRAISLNLPVPGTQECVVDIASIGPEATSTPGWDGSERPDVREPQTLEEFGAVLAQDALRVPLVQKGIRSKAFGGILLGDSEIRIRHYHAEIDKYLGRR